MSELAGKLEDLERRFKEAAASAGDERELDAVRVAFLGRSGEVTLLRRGIGQLPADERPDAGKVINAAVETMEAFLLGVVTQLVQPRLAGFTIDAKRWPKLSAYFERALARPSIKDAVDKSKAMLGLT